MEEKELKTSIKQRIFIAVIAFIMLGSIIASYVAIILNGSKGNSDTSKIDAAKLAEYQAAYEEKIAEFQTLSKADFDEFIKFRSEIKAFNENSANENGVQIKDLKIGDGVELSKDGDNYLAYYVGYCADESIFDSTLNDNSNPTAFEKVLDPSLGMIEGWNAGIEGMKIGGIRRITVPAELAYGESMEICGGTNKPLRFLVMAVADEEPIKSLANELDTAYIRYQYAQYGIDYDAVMQND